MTRGRPHRVYLRRAFVLALQFAAVSLMTWPGWKPLAIRILGLD